MMNLNKEGKFDKYFQWNYLITVVVVVMAFIILLCVQKCHREEVSRLKMSLTAADGEVVQYRNKLNQEITEKETIIIDGSNKDKKYLKNLKTKDSLIMRLQAKVKDVNGFAVAVNTETIIEKEILIPGDSIRNFTEGFKDEWVDLKLTRRDSILKFSLGVTNKETIVQKDGDRVGFLGPKKQIVEVTQLNPYTTTTGVQSITVVPKKRNLVGKIAVGALVGFVAGAIIAR